MKLSHPGFTLIEVLIVVVVIGILAAMTTIGLGQYQRNARNTETIAVVQQYVGAIKSYAAATNAYPFQDEVETSMMSKIVCLGEGYDGDACWLVDGPPVGGNDQYLESTELENALEQYFDPNTKKVPNTDFPPVNRQKIDYYNSIYVGATYGYIYDVGTQKGKASILYMLNGDVSCGNIADARVLDNIGTATMCQLDIYAE